MDVKQKWEYFSKSLEIAWNVYQTCCEKLREEYSKEYQSFIESKNENDYQEYLREVELPFRNTLNSSLLISFCSLLENVVVDITKEHVQDYSKRIKYGTGNWLIKNLKLLNENRMIVDTNTNDVIFLCYYILIRNCIVHNGGKIDESQNPKKLKNAIEKIKKYDEERNYILIDDKDDIIFIESGLISDFVIKSEEMVEMILEKI